MSTEPSKCDLEPSTVNCQFECAKTSRPISGGDNLGQTESENQHAPGPHTEDTRRYWQKESTSNNAVNGSSVSGSKRDQLTYEGQQPLVHIRYESISRESKMKLEELLSEWSKWHAEHCSSSKFAIEAVESGDATFFPALHCGSEKSSLSFFMDTQVRKKQKMEFVSLNGDSAPLYDREYAFALTSTVGSSNDDRGLEHLSASRCFNCASYSHSLRDCPKPRDNVTVNNARKGHQSKKNLSAGPRVPTRYYQNSPCGKYDGLQPGALDTETRKLLGLGEFDPPPWLNRMRDLGYPPGYLDIDEEDQPSGITIYIDEESKKQDEEMVRVGPSEPRKKRSVDFPGINAPIPENGDQSRWAAASQMQPDLCNPAYRSNHLSNYTPELISGGGHSYSQRWRPDSSTGSGFFSGYAQELNSFMSGYSGSSMDIGFGCSSGSGSLDGFSEGRSHGFDFRPAYSPSYGGPNHSSESHSPYVFSPYSLANSRQT